MPIYDFGTEVPDVAFVAANPDFRSDVEQRSGQLSVHDHDAPEIRTARTLVDEMINTSGAEVFVYIRTNNADHDSVWDEDADPTYWEKVPIKAYFKPEPLEAELKKWGSEIVNKTEVIFSHKQLYELFGERMLRAGDVIKLPYNAATAALAPKNYRVENGTPSGNFRYVWLYFTCVVETLTADITVRPLDAPPMTMESGVQHEEVYRETI